MRNVHNFQRIKLFSSVAIIAGLLVTSVQGQDNGRQIVVPTSSGPITLDRKISADLAERVQALIKRRVDRFAGAPRQVPILVAFDRKMGAKARADLQAAGFNLGPRLGDNTLIVFATEDSASRLGEVPGLVGADILPATAKIAADVRRPEPLEWEKRDGGRRAYSVLLFDGVSAKEVEALRELADGLVFESYDPRTIGIVRVLTIVMDPSDVTRIAEEPIIARIEPAAPPDEDQNLLNTQPLSNVNNVQVAPYNLSGAGITVGIWEANDVIRATHNDLTPRVLLQETDSMDNHAAHVAGTVGASGVNAPNAEGMAPAVTIGSWNANNDANEMTTAATSPGGAGDPPRIVASNHSYGIGRGWSSDGSTFATQVNFGQYTNISVGFDNVVAGTDLVVVKAAGNERNDAWDGVSTDVSIPNPIPPRDCTQNGLGVDADCLGDRAVAKNIITVGAMNGVGAIANFSSFGPTDDGRIKPDLMANGTNVFSLGAASDSATFTTQGTSMSTPAVTGMVALLLEEAGNQGLPLSAAAVKAVLIQTAQDVTVGQATVGPDFATGWGIADIQAAVDLLRQPGGPGVAQETLSAAGVAGTYSQAFLVPAGLPELHMTLVWTDPAGNPLAPQNQAKLVNDLDLRLISPTGTVVQPWTLNPGAPGNAAVRNGGDDAVNNVEQVSVLSPAAGVWQIQVSAKAASFAGPQNFAVAGLLTPSSGPFMTDPADIMLVLDRSGSMNLPAATPGISKIQALKSAADEVANFLEIAGGHQLGLVRFSSTASATIPTFNLQPLDATSIGTAEMAIANLSGGGRTNIIDGITDAVAQLAGPGAVNSRQAIVLFTDGRHNEPPGSNVNDIDAIMANDTLFYSIGFGTDVDSTVLPGVAANHNGTHLEEQNLTAAELSKLFLTLAGVAIDETVVIDPDYTVQPGGIAVQNMIASLADRSITFATHWNNQNAEQFSFRVQGPNKRCRIPTKDHPGYQTRTGDRYNLVRIDLPYTCPHTGEQLHAGTWSLAIRSQATQTDTAKVVVLSQTALRLVLDARVRQNVLQLRAWLDKGGEVVIDGARMKASLVRNRPSTKDSGKQDDTKPRRSVSVGTLQPTTTGRLVLDRPIRDLRPFLVRPEIAARIDPNLLMRMSKLRPLIPDTAFEPVKMIMLELRDDGKGSDETALDGIYSAQVKLEDPGLYRVHATAALPSKLGVISREALTSALIK